MVNIESNAALKPLELSPTANMKPLHGASGKKDVSSAELKEQFGQTVGTIFYTQMMKALRSTAGETKYLNGGQAEKMFQSQFDQVVVEAMAKRGDNHFADAMQTAFEAGVQGGIARLPSLDPLKAGKFSTEVSSESLDTRRDATKSTESERQNLSEQLADLSRQTQTLREARSGATGATEFFPMIRK